MTTIQHIQTPTVRINTHVIRKAALAVLAIASTALVVLAVGKSNPAEALGAVIDWTASMYFVVLIAAVVGIAVLGARENTLESRKTQYDIR